MHRRPRRRAPPSKRAQTSGPGETSQSQPQGPSTTSPAQAPSAENPLAFSPHSLIQRPLFHCGPIAGNADCSDKSFHNENYYDFPAFAALPELRDPMRLVQRYFLEPFMVPRQYFYPRVVFEFYQTMTSRGEQHPTTLHFSVDGRQGVLRASDIASAFGLPVALANSVDYWQWLHPSPQDMVLLLSRDTSVGTILLRRQLPPGMIFVDHVLRSNIFPLQHWVQKLGAILEALYRIYEGFWFSLIELVMTALFHFEEKVHRKSLSRAEAIPLLFLRLISQVLEHMRFPDEPRLKRRRVCTSVFTVHKWKFLPRSLPLPLEEPPEEQQPDPADDFQMPAHSPSVATEPLPASFGPLDAAGPSIPAPPYGVHPHHS